MAFYRTSNPEVVLRMANAAIRNPFMVVTTYTAGRTVTVQPGSVAWTPTAYHDEPGYGVCYSHRNWPHAMHARLPAHQEFYFNTPPYGEGEEEACQE